MDYWYAYGFKKNNPVQADLQANKIDRVVDWSTLREQGARQHIPSNLERSQCPGRYWIVKLTTAQRHHRCTWLGCQCKSLDLIAQYRTRIKKIPRKVPDGIFCMKSIAFAATDEMKPPLSFPRMIFKSTHKITNRKAASITSQPNFVICRIISF